MKNRRKTSLLLGSVIIIILISSPYLLYLSELVDSEAKELNTVFGLIEAGYYGTIQHYIYFVSAKIVPLILLITLFLTNKSWWAPAILVPISVYLFQLIGVFNDASQILDEIEFIYTVPILVPVIVILFFIRYKISIYINALDLKKEMEKNMNIPKKN